MRSAGLDHCWNLPEESLRGQGPPGSEESLLTCDTATCVEADEEEEKEGGGGWGGRNEGKTRFIK